MKQKSTHQIDITQKIATTSALLPLVIATLSCSAIDSQRKQQALLGEYLKIQSELSYTQGIYVDGGFGKIKNCRLAEAYLEKWQRHSHFLALNPNVLGAFKFIASSLIKTSEDFAEKLKSDLQTYCPE